MDLNSDSSFGVNSTTCEREWCEHFWLPVDIFGVRECLFCDKLRDSLLNRALLQSAKRIDKQ